MSDAHMRDDSLKTVGDERLEDALRRYRVAKSETGAALVRSGDIPHAGAVRLPQCTTSGTDGAGGIQACTADPQRSGDSRKTSAASLKDGGLRGETFDSL